MESRKEEIIKKAAILFKDKGYSAVTMRDIADACQIKAASLYNHISGKQEILKSIIIALAEAFTDGMETIKGKDLSSAESLKEIIRMHVDISVDNKEGMSSLNNDWMHLEDELVYYLDMRKKYELNFREIIQQGIASKEFVNRNDEVMLFSILSTLRALYIWLPEGAQFHKETFTKDLTDTLLSGVVVKA